MNFSTKSNLERYKRLISLLDNHFKTLKMADCDHEVLNDLRSVLNHLKGKNLAEIALILNNKKSSAKQKEKLPPSPSLGNLSIEQIRAKLESPKTPKATMEKIATERFNLPKGGLTSLRNRQALKEKIESLIDEESSHDAIRQLALETKRN